MKLTRHLLTTTLCLLGANLHAQSLTVYGRVDMSLSRQTRIVSGGKVTDQSLNALDSGGYSGTRIGFKGQEDLGDGLKAMFVLEEGVQLDTGAIAQGGRAFGRQSYVGLEGSAGRVTLGRQYTPWFDTLSTADPFGNNFVGNSGNVIFANARADNAILYRSPTVGGFTGHAMVAMGESVTGRQTNLAGHYQSGALWLGATYGEYTQDGKTGKFGLLGGTYDFGAVKLFANVTRLRDLNPTAQAAPTLQAGATGSTWLLGASARLGAGTAMASYINLNDQRTLDRDARQFAVGYIHPLSARTSLYGGFARIVNRNGGTLTANTPSYPGAGEAQTQVGITHTF